jgi:hypothetical protein
MPGCRVDRYSDRLNTVRSGFADGSARLGLDLVRNLAAGFWPDLKEDTQAKDTEFL